MSDATIICRCEDLTVDEIRTLLANGSHTIEEIKRSCRCGMGPCQGRTCVPLVAQEISKATGKPIGEVVLPTFRPPIAPIKLGALAGGDPHD